MFIWTNFHVFELEKWWKYQKLYPVRVQLEYLICQCSSAHMSSRQCKMIALPIIILLHNCCMSVIVHVKKSEEKESTYENEGFNDRERKRKCTMNTRDTSYKYNMVRLYLWLQKWKRNSSGGIDRRNCGVEHAS